MTAKRLDGRQLAKTMQEEIAQQCARLWDEHQVRPGLAAVLVGEDPASQKYVASKQKRCKAVGIESWLHSLPDSTQPAELLALIDQLNADPKVHGILVQLPLPKQIQENDVIQRVSPNKDVDGFSPESLGKLAAGCPRFLPCTPHGIQQLLIRNDIEIEGKHVVILGRSTIVGTPLALLLSRKASGGNATVTLCHSRTPDFTLYAKEADIVIIAAGQPELLKASMIRPGAVVVDVGIHKRADGKLVGDVAFEEVQAVASAITPVPGGVGPMTITMLLHNTLESAKENVS